MNGFIFLILILMAVFISALSAGDSSGVFGLNRYQLKRKAQFGDANAKLVYSLFSRRFQLMSTLLITNILANTTIVVLVNSKVSGFFAVLFSTIVILLFGELLPMVYIKKNVVFVAAKLYPALSRLMSVTEPITKRMGSIFNNW